MHLSSPKQFISIFLLPLLTLFLGIGIGSSHGPINAPSLLTSTTGSVFAQSTATTPDEHNLALFWDVWKRLQKEHPDGKKVTEEDLIYGATKGLAASIGDPYTYFLTPAESKEFNTSLNGELEGIGAELTETEGGILTVVATLPGTPAERSGMLPGDILYKINEESAAGMTLYAAVQKIRGPKNSEVKISVVRKNEKEPLTFTIKREEIKVPSVTSEQKENGSIAYIKILKFSESTTSELTSIINKILLTPPKSIILDLRDNGGGYLDASADVTSMFLEKGKIVTTRGTKADSIQEKSATGEARLAKYPLVILQNEQTASAAEIVAGALKDNNRAHLIGTHTYGKGSVQELEPLANGAYLRITIAKWFTPNGYNVGDKIDGVKIGLPPHEEVSLSLTDRKEKKDPQLEKAISYLKGLDTKK